MTADPFHIVRFSRTKMDAVERTMDMSAPDLTPQTRAAFQRMRSTSIPLEAYKTTRILAMHLWALMYNSDPSIVTMGDPDRRLVPENGDTLLEVMNSICDNSPMDLLSSFCRAFCVMDLASPADMDHPLAGPATPSTPARAEMIQNLSSYWSGEYPGCPLPEDKSIYGLETVDPSMPDNCASHFAMIPMLVPTKGSSTSIDPSTAWIPLAWSWDPRVRTGATFDSDAGYATGCGRDLDQGNIICWVTDRSVHLTPPNYSRFAEPTVRWRYAIVRVPADAGPVRRTSTEVYDSFSYSAGFWRLRYMQNAANGMRAPGEHLGTNDNPSGNLLHTADAPLLARVLGSTKEHAALLHMSLHSRTAYGTHGSRFYVDNAGDRPSVDSPLLKDYFSLYNRYEGKNLAYGQWSALTAGLRYLVMAWRSGHITGTMPTQHSKLWRDDGMLLPPTDRRLGLLIPPRATSTHVGGMEKVSSRGKPYKTKPHRRKMPRKQRPKPMTPGSYSWTMASDKGPVLLGARDVTVAKHLIISSVAAALERHLEAINSGQYGVAKDWVEKAAVHAGLPNGIEDLARFAERVAAANVNRGSSITYAAKEIITEAPWL